MVKVCFLEVSEESVSGFVTYKNEFLWFLQENAYTYYNIILGSSRNHLVIERDGAKITLHIPNCQRMETVGTLLSMYIEDSEDTVFFQNFAISYPTLSMIKKHFPLSKIVYVIHDFIWASYLMGNVESFKRIIRRQESCQNIKEINAFYKDGIKSFNIANKIVCLSNDTYDLLSDFYKVNQKKLTIIPNGLRNSDIYANNKTRLNLRKQYGISQHCKILLFVGRLTRQKGINILLQAYSRLCKTNENTLLVLAGNGTTSIFKNLPPKVSQHISLLGTIEKERLYQWYQIADWGLICSYYEQCSYVAIEMKMFSLPVICSDAFGVKCMFDESNSIIYHISDNDIKTSDNLFEKLSYALSMHNSISKYREAAQMHYQSLYTHDIMAKKYKKLLYELTYTQSNEYK